MLAVARFAIPSPWLEMSDCSHGQVDCLNHYELIRKYRCRSCGAVMMCGCDEDIGRSDRPHQIQQGTEYESRRRVPVTAGFQPRICNECRGIPEKAHPMAEIHGRT